MYLCPVAKKHIKNNIKNGKTCKQQTSYYSPRAYCVRGRTVVCRRRRKQTDDNGNNRNPSPSKEQNPRGKGFCYYL